MSIQIPSIFAVVITFYPDFGDLRTLIGSLRDQVTKIIIVDNGSSEFATFSTLKNDAVNLDILGLGDNLGIGHAQNVGIEYAQNEGADFVVLFDQDSCPEANMIQTLRCEALKLQLDGVPLAAVAPCYKDAQGGMLSSFVRVGFFGFKRTAIVPNSGPIEADFLISSGSLIPISTINDIGGVDATLFIDHVDTEWCFRAKANGYRLFGIPDAVMLHSLGDRRIRFWFLRWRTVPYHSPFRYYYMFRNSVLLQKRPYMPLKWKLADFGRCARALFFFGLFSSSRRACLKMMLRGVIDGMAGTTGKMK